MTPPDPSPRRAAELIKALDLEPHPEGGFYREVFRSEGIVNPADQRGERSALTTIYFLLTDDSHSRWHRVRSDEVWHLYEGGPLEVMELDAECRDVRTHTLAAVDVSGARPVHTVAAGTWQAARSVGPYALMGCTVGPGFDFADFELLADHGGIAVLTRDRHPAIRAFW
jgi:predicted cupin superfamily sugar epimerase